MSEVPGIGRRMEERLNRAGVVSMGGLLATQPKQLRRIWGNVNGERMWYALHGHDIQAARAGRSMYGHGRVLPPGWRGWRSARDCSRLLLAKAARRMRRGNYRANRVWLWLDLRNGGWSGHHGLPCVNDDHACLAGLAVLWDRGGHEISAVAKIVRVSVALGDLTPAAHLQLDLFSDDDPERRKWEAVTDALDFLNGKFGKRVVSIGAWTPPPGGYAGGKIAYTRIPAAEDFW